jgi:peptidyl-prolyl cis-trans isomerase SurA
VRIDKDKLKKKVIEDNDKEVRSFLLSEILFKLSENQNLDQKFNLIKNDIYKKGFLNAVLLHSISDTAVNGGELGWITEKSLNPKIRNEIYNLDIGNFTNPIIIPGGFLILKLNKSKNEKNKYDVEKKIDELIRFTTNQQLNRLSNIYYDKVKKEIKIDEL